MTKKTRRKKGAASGPKGATFERAVARLFTDRFGAEFRRVPRSGAFTGGRNRQINETLGDDAKNVLSGDIFGPMDFKFSVECKNYQDEPKFHHIMAGESRMLNRWLEQADDDAEFADKIPLLLFKITRVGEYACIHEDIEDFDYEHYPHIRYNDRVILTLDNFLNALGDSYIPEN